MELRRKRGSSKEIGWVVFELLIDSAFAQEARP